MSGEKEIEREIVIVRRGRESEGEGHHGGVWKIAYADFMTAMMAFFLVMWLVNATNEETKASVASYFNPIKLMDEKPADRNISDDGTASEGITDRPAADTQGEGTSDGASAEQGNDQNATAGEKESYSEADYFENPYAVLAEIAMETGQQTNISDAGEGGAQQSGPSTGASGGEAYRDPFDPDFWSQAAAPEPTLDPVSDTQAMLSPEALAEDQPESEEPEPAAPVAEAAEPVPAPAEETAAAEAAPPAEPAIDPADLAAERAAADAAALREEIAEALGGANGRLAEGLDVQPAEGGVLISLTDEGEDSMFNVGSAVPRREMVLAMEEIGGLLADRQGAVVIRGHTDARPFTGEGNDNWRLSTDRAHSAYYMLVRGGLAEERIVQVSGFADRRLKLPDDPFASANRRIEILVEGKGAP
ncbi:MotB family protein [Pararhizobium haloflavum]|uniref:MotB family protein n=1 Tax=Pararhizobium haloflavum TaxID=2037914 RepID=UPI000C1791C2|nr:MotB family protein [Pararhizobium haloflavum]